MKKKFIVFYLFFILSLASFAQDIVTTQTGDRLSVKVIAVNNNDVTYKLNDIDITTSKADIESIQFSNGEKITFGHKNKNRWYKAEKRKSNKHFNKNHFEIFMYTAGGCICAVLIGFLILAA